MGNQKNKNTESQINKTDATNGYNLRKQKEALQRMYDDNIKKKMVAFIESEEQKPMSPTLEGTSGKHIATITFVSSDGQTKNIHSFYINRHVQDVHKLPRLSSEVRKLPDIAKGKDVPFKKQTLDYINFNKKCVLYRNGEYQLTKILEKQASHFRISPEITVEVISVRILRRRTAQAKKRLLT